MVTRCLILVLFSLHAIVLAADIEKSIFDDDWQSSPPTQVKPPTPVPPVTPTPDNPTPTPVVPTPPVVVQSVRVAIPTTTAQADAWKLIKEELYKDDIANAKTAAQKVALAKKLLAVARDTKKDMVGKYVLLVQAKEIAIGSGDPSTAFKCLGEMGRSFDINYPSMKVDLFTSLSTTVSGPAECRTVATGLNRWADGQVKSDRYDVAASAVKLSVTVARKSGDATLVKTTELHQQQISEIEAAYLSIKPALTTLADKPTDPTANLAVGRFYCLMKGDWDRGLPMLALGSDASLKTLATMETAGVSGADAQMAVGDGWWNLVEKEKGLAQDRIRSRAIKWYRQALPGLEGLAKAKVEKRITQNTASNAPLNQTVDLLKLIDLQSGDANGLWSINGSGLHLTPDPNTKIYWVQYVPPEEYYLIAAFTRTKKSSEVNNITLGLPFAGSNYLFNLYSRKEGTSIIGLLSNGKDGMTGPFVAITEPGIRTGQTHNLRLEIRKDFIQAYFEGKLVLKLEASVVAKNTELSRSGGKGRLGIRCWHSEITFSEFRIKDITGTGKRLDGSGEKEGTGDTSKAQPTDSRQPKLDHAQQAALQKYVGKWTIEADRYYEVSFDGNNYQVVQGIKGAETHSSEWSSQGNELKVRFGRWTISFNANADGTVNIDASSSDPAMRPKKWIGRKER